MPTETSVSTWIPALHAGMTQSLRSFTIKCSFLRDLCIALLSKNKNQHVCHRLQRSSGDFQGLECGQHLALKFLERVIERMKDLGWPTALRPTDSGQYWFDHLLAQDQQRRQGSDAGSAHSIAPRFA